MKVLITAGTVYGPLDDNKLVGNRVRGIWAAKYAAYLVKRGFEVTLLHADIQEREIRSMTLGDLEGTPVAQRAALQFVPHKGFWDYQDKCVQMASEHDGAVMAAAVVNWIPEKPFAGKMPTKGVGDRMNVTFILAPRVIDQMKRENPRLTLIGCKMTIGESFEGLVDAAYGTLLGARCNAVVANDMKSGLRQKWLVHQDRTTVPFDVIDDRFYPALTDILTDDHYRTETDGQLTMANASATLMFDRVVEKYRARFVRRLPDGTDFVFGAVAVPYNGPNAKAHLRQEALVSPREKGRSFDARSAVMVSAVEDRVVRTFGGKATLNAPLLVRHLERYPEAHGVLHLHEQLPSKPTVPYFPPGTVRDSQREIPGPVYNIEGHGFIACLDANGEIWK